MNSDKATLAIYGIQDRSNYGYPEYVHDHSIVLIKNGNVEKMAELERVTRKKHDNSMHKNIYELLKSEKLINSDLYDVVFVDNIVGRSFISSIRYPIIGFPFMGSKCFGWSIVNGCNRVAYPPARMMHCIPIYGFAHLNGF